MTGDKERPVILWFRKDLRLDDNRALHAACARGRPVIPLYIRETDKGSVGPLGAAQAWWLHHSLVAMTHSLRKRGSALVLASGDALAVIDALIESTGASGVFWNRRYDPQGAAIDARIEDALKGTEVETGSFAGQLLHEPARLLTSSGSGYRVYTPFRRALEGSCEPDEPIAAPPKIASPARWPRSENLASWALLRTHPDWAEHFLDLWTPGEAAALKQLEDFVERSLVGYRSDRDFPGKPGTSMLSPYLAMGEISPARIWHATRGLTKHVPAADIISFRKELIWREFCYHLFFHFPRLREDNWNNRFDALAWNAGSQQFESWTKGMTGYPIVDAGMRQLWKYGWMHNRVRMITASFLIKDLLIDWRRGEAWFRDTLVDADPANNPANWQWVAGTGADASPFFRIFNPVLQGEKFDPEGGYVRVFVPELAGLDAKYLHRPFEAPQKALEAAGIILGETYPQPIVNHGEVRERALQAYRAIKNAS